MTETDQQICYKKFGLRATFKPSLAEILWLRDSQNIELKDKVWLSVADFIVYHLTGVYQTDVSLACRTLAFRVDSKEWDREWLRSWSVPEDIFPPVIASGLCAGKVNNHLFQIPLGIPVSVCGHDHVVAAVAMGAVRPGAVYDSIGTAEALIRALPERPLTQADYKNGVAEAADLFQ